jgi:hypothetical protein
MLLAPLAQLFLFSQVTTGRDLALTLKGAFGVSGFMDRKELILALQSGDGRNADMA